MSFDFTLLLYSFSHVRLIGFCYFLRSHSYTSIGSIYDTVPNALLCINNSSGSKEVFRPAYLLSDGRLERAGRVKKLPSSVSRHNPAIINGLDNVDLHKSSLLTASAIAVGDEIL